MSSPRIEPRALSALALSTLAFTVCFAAWVQNGVLVTFLVDNRVFAFDKAQIGWLLGLPVLTGSVLRLPVGMATDRFGGRLLFPIVMLAAAAGALLESVANSYTEFVIASLLFGLAGASFAVGVAYTSLWFPKERQGTALGIFGAGNIGAAFTSILAPSLLLHFTQRGANLDAWRFLPRIYAAALVITATAFALLTKTRLVDREKRRTLRQQIKPLRSIRVWRFGLYYFVLFGGFVALAQWLIPYFVNVYGMTVAKAGFFAAAFSLPSAGIRAVGGWLSDRFGARTVLYSVFGMATIGALLLAVPRMDIDSPGEGVMSTTDGVVTAVSPTEIAVGAKRYPVIAPRTTDAIEPSGTTVLPHERSWQVPMVKVGDHVVKRQLLAHGNTHVYFQATLWVFTLLLFLVGLAMGTGMAAVYKHIPHYFPDEVGVVGGLVGVVGGLGGFLCPILFGGLLQATGIWTTCWMFIAAMAAVSLLWMHFVVRGMVRRAQPETLRETTRPRAPVPEGSR